MVDGLAGLVGVIIGLAVGDLIGLNVGTIDGYVLGGIVGLIVDDIFEYESVKNDSKGVSCAVFLSMTSGVEECITLIKLMQL